MPDSSRRPIDGYALITCLVLCIIWGLQQVAIKAAGSDVSPMLQVSVRSGVAALLLLITAKFVLHEKWNPKLRWRDGFLLALGFAGEFFFVAEGLRFTSAAHMSVLLYTAPLFAAVGLAIKLPEERLSVIQVGRRAARVSRYRSRFSASGAYVPFSRRRRQRTLVVG